jgi:hypothetical protein
MLEYRIPVYRSRAELVCLQLTGNKQCGEYEQQWGEERESHTQGAKEHEANTRCGCAWQITFGLADNYFAIYSAQHQFKKILNRQLC